MSKHCTECGRELLPESKYCDNCGEEQTARPASDAPPRSDQPRNTGPQPTPERNQHSQPPEPGHSQPARPESRGHARQPGEHPVATQSPAWPLGALVGLWVLWFVGASIYGTEATTGGLVMFVAVAGSLPLMYIDAKAARDAGELEVTYPVAVPLATLLLWVFALPAYLIYRWTKR